MPEFHVIIPARYESTRLPAKALANIGEAPMIVHVCQQASASGAQSVTVATDHQAIFDSVTQAGYAAVMTKTEHPSGSDRVCEAAELLGLKDQDILVNVQGDEPFIPPENIRLVAQLLAQTTHPMSTLCSQIGDAKEALDPNAVKVVFDSNHRALYFSRSLIPYNRDNPVSAKEPLTSPCYRHIGIYGYRMAFLQEFIRWQPSPLEKLESLEQLRVLDKGYSIAIDCLEQAPPAGVDTLEDLVAARHFYSEGHPGA